MKNARCLGRYLALLVSLGIGLVSLPGYSAPPDIVFILTDDLDQDLFRRQGALAELLVAQGITFANHFVSLSLCCPSRVTTLRGQYAHNTGIYTNGPGNGGFAKVYRDGLEYSTVATWLQAAGYRTALIGKYLNGYPDPRAASHNYIPPGWHHWISPNGGTPYREYDYTLNEDGTTVSYGHRPEDYLVDVLARKAAQFIRRSAAIYPKQPLFLYLAPYIPHGPATPPPRYAGWFPGLRAPRTAAFNEADVSDKPVWLRTLPPLSAEEIKRLDILYRHRRQSMLAVDDLVKTVIGALEATGRLANAYVFFTSDNGFHQGQHRLSSGKNTAFEEDLRIPLVVRGPGVPAGRSVTHLTANVDYAPTFAELAGLTAPSFVDGRSLAVFLKGAIPPAWREVLLLEHAGPALTARGARGVLEPQDPYDVQLARRRAPPSFTGLRTADGLTYVEYVTGDRELYDLKQDPDQLNNSYPTADPVLKARLAAWLRSLRGTSGATLRAAEQAPPRAGMLSATVPGGPRPVPARPADSRN